MPGPRPSTLDRLGGTDAVDDLLAALAQRVADDPDLGPRLRAGDQATRCLRQLLLHALTDAAPTPRAEVAAVHAGRRVTARQFALLAGHLADTLRDLGFDHDEVGDVLTAVASARSAVVEPLPAPPVA